MKQLLEIKELQKVFIEECILKAKSFIESISTDDLEVILLSGSVARGDYMPGQLGGMIDLTVMKKRGSTLTPEDIFGKDQEPEIPYHCVQFMGQWFQIAFGDVINENDFSEMFESRKFALLESIPLWSLEKEYSLEKEKITKNLKTDLFNKKESSLNFINHYLSEYKKDRWIRREAYLQLHANLDNSIELAIKCLFYINGKYAPAEDRRLYYSFDLPLLPENYRDMLEELFSKNIMSYSDYQRREQLFRSRFLPIFDKS